MAAVLTEKIFEAYVHLGRETERIVYSMMLSQKTKIKSLKDLNLLEVLQAIHEADAISVSFDEGELTIGSCYEVHSVSGVRDENHEPEVYINVYDTEDEEPHSIRMCEFPHLADLFKVIVAVDEKCLLKFSE